LLAEFGFAVLELGEFGRELLCALAADRLVHGFGFERA
jgi:hypothetical protein